VRSSPASVQAAGAEVAVLDYAVPSWRGLTYPTRKYYPTWLLPRITAAAGRHGHLRATLRDPPKWTLVFSTNGVAVMGMHGIPCIGFGPGSEVFAHMATEQIPVEHLVKAAAWYAAFPGAYSAAIPRGLSSSGLLRLDGRQVDRETMSSTRQRERGR